MEKQMSTKWSPAFCGVTHLGSTDDMRWATVQERGAGAELLKWVKGCGFSPDSVKFGSADEAKLAGEAWVARGV